MQVHKQNEQLIFNHVEQIPLDMIYLYLSTKTRVQHMLVCKYFFAQLNSEHWWHRSLALDYKATTTSNSRQEYQNRAHFEPCRYSCATGSEYNHTLYELRIIGANAMFRTAHEWTNEVDPWEKDVMKCLGLWRIVNGKLEMFQLQAKDPEQPPEMWLKQGILKFDLLRDGYWLEYQLDTGSTIAMLRERFISYSELMEPW